MTENICFTGLYRLNGPLRSLTGDKVKRDPEFLSNGPIVIRKNPLKRSVFALHREGFRTTHQRHGKLRMFIQKSLFLRGQRRHLRIGGNHIFTIQLQQIIRLICLQLTESHVNSPAQFGLLCPQHDVGGDHRCGKKHPIAYRNGTAGQRGICLPLFHAQIHRGLIPIFLQFCPDSQFPAVIQEIIQIPGIRYIANTNRFHLHHLIRRRRIRRVPGIESDLFLQDGVLCKDKLLFPFVVAQEVDECIHLSGTQRLLHLRNIVITDHFRFKTRIHANGHRKMNIISLQFSILTGISVTGCSEKTDANRVTLLGTRRNRHGEKPQKHGNAHREYSSPSSVYFQHLKRLEI